jgi:soluble lytic murein transglycosylase
LAALVALRPTLERQLYPRKYADLTARYAAEYAVPEALLFAVIRTESSFRPNAVSNVGARGLTQIMPETFRWLQSKTGEQLPLDTLFTPEVSIRYGALLLHLLLEEFVAGGAPYAAAAYHAGRGQLNQWLQNSEGRPLEQIAAPATRHYMRKVMQAYEKYTKLYGGT